ncbi:MULTISPECIES: formate dehydrogenase subunit gamma [unclassified Gilliamella]|uniref:formate dehydrogenase subunit gamma n=1 Tax=unclassified Gilliamella TaxID=2685620 RepID=UPI002269DE75|nr:MULTISPECIES: formate dehydrogenase subunit gamma [unclassified Gilliamella]MCX8601777.1 formate dehydrogenase subunit gamma [Gilliamella sp. B3722]MCX8608148.1 formate dehydrogenase subunit gamma [Gilliamella sp. B3771]MCX8611151.1 formate dehydrogenase subunit gamma [Gilliamella sp. B3891]MCX8613508.1 formate dehydrogenase subunit gamma [Gilliamella sp. B3773]MCX8614389.1 formate dehydrogenase subunit gamma [Gilliamella sp. B3770]
MNKKGMILRTPLIVRFCHWCMVCLFILTALSGLSLFFPSIKLFSLVLGTPQLVRALHPIIGCVVFVLLMLMFLKLAHHNIPNKNDIIWIKNFKSVIMGKEEGIPIGKYNIGQKFLFWCIMGLISVLFITGMIMWRRYVSDYFPVYIVRIAIFFHSLAAIALILLAIGHAYMAIWVKGSIKGMITGYVSRAWARKNHSAWYEEEMQQLYQQELKENSDSKTEQAAQSDQKPAEI